MTPAEPEELLFVYNADGGLLHAIGDIAHKILSPATYPCRLCELTHGYFRERAEWRAFVADLGVKCTFLHRSELDPVDDVDPEQLPAVYRRVGDCLQRCLGPDALNACRDLAELMDLVRARCFSPADKDA